MLLLSDLLCVHALHLNRSTVLHLPVSQLGGSLAPHSRFKTCFTTGQGFWEIQVEAGISWLEGGEQQGQNQTSDTSRLVMQSSSDR